MQDMDKSKIVAGLKALQDEICHALEQLDGSATFTEDGWDRPGGGGGRTRVIEGKNIEKGGVNFSEVYGSLSPEAARALGIPANDFFASGVSIVLHPSNPWVPIIHMNVRYFEAGESWWFGGGIDASPHYISIQEAAVFHQKLKNVCDQSHESFYPRFKKWADDYFYIKHRKETRGIGGIFFDRLTEPEISFESGMNFILEVGRTFIPCYTPLFLNNYKRDYDDSHKNWQLLRRGRYVEFNLAWDRGTRFGLETDGRTESILMSLPKDARWIYNHKPAKASLEAETLALLKKDIDWLNAAKS
jgi:coproporphyrinogen III oxidase